MIFCDLREWWRQSGLVVLVILLGSTLMSSWIDLASLLHKFWTRSKMSLCLLASVNNLYWLLLYISSDGPAACKKLLDKSGLEGYQVISLLTKLSSSVLSCFCDEFPEIWSVYFCRLVRPKFSLGPDKWQTWILEELRSWEDQLVSSREKFDLILPKKLLCSYVVLLLRSRLFVEV